MRLIDADALLEKLGMANDCKGCPNCVGPFCGLSGGLMDVCDEITNAPTIEPMQVHETKAYDITLADLFGQEKSDEILSKAREFGAYIGAVIADLMGEKK